MRVGAHELHTGVPTQDLRVLTINLKHTLLMDVGEQDGDILVLPNQTMLNPLYVKNMHKKPVEADAPTESLVGKTIRADENIGNAPRLRQTRQNGLIL